jgi:hypothetical protein
MQFKESAADDEGLHLAAPTRKGVHMSSKTILYGIRIGIVTAIFSAGYLCGSMPQHNANAQMGDFGGELLKKAAESGGTLGSIAQLGTAITDMEKNVSGLQKNIDILKQVKAALGGK